MDVLTIIIGIILFVIFLHKCGQQKRPVKAMAINSMSGLAGLVAAAVITGFAGCGVAVNAATVLTAAVLGLPGVAMILASLFLL